MTITNALTRLYSEAKANNIDLSDYDDEDLTIKAIDFLTANLFDVFEDEDENEADGLCPQYFVEKGEELLRNWTQEDEDDDWVGISEDWDLNLFTDEDGTKHGRLYPVRRGNTVVNARSFCVG